jgi:hypothetical protein
MRDSMGENSRLTTACSSHNEQRSTPVFDSLALLRIQARQQGIWVVLREEV